MRIADSNVQLTIQHSASRTQEHQTQAVAVRPDLADPTLQAQLEFNARADLRQYDTDGNLWLDESDPRFADLSIWVNGNDGSSSLRSLHEMGVGAIYLGASADDFELTSTLGVPLGSIRAHSVVLMENGDVRSAQQLDLVDQTPTVALVTTAPMQVAAAQPQYVGEVSMEPDKSRASLQRLRSLQRDYHRQQLKKQEKKPKSLLEQLLQKMELIRERYRDVQLRRERVNRLYTHD